MTPRSAPFILIALLVALPGVAQAQPAAPITPPEAPAEFPRHNAPATPQDTDPEAPDAEASTYVGWIELTGTLREGPLPFAWVDDSAADDTLQSVLDRIEYVRTRDDHTGLVISLDQPQLSLTQCTAIATAIQRLRDAGKPVVAFAEVYSLRDYLIASAADRVVLQHKGGVELTGLSVEELYLAGMLKKIGVEADFVQVGKYKGADEPLTRTGPSEAWDENFNSLLDDLYAQVLTQIAAGRGKTEAEIEALMADAWTLTDEELLERGAVDELADGDLLDVTTAAYGDDFVWDTELGLSEKASTPDNPFALFTLLFQEPTRRTTRPTIAVINAVGPIMSGESSVGDGLFTSDSVGSRSIVAALEEVLNDDNIKGAVVHIDSPGGSALASEVIWQAMRELGEEKPLYVSVGSMAASGGYYMACAADRVYVQPQSIVGSIGVVGGKLALGGLYDWAGINVVRRNRGPSADLFNSVEPFTEAQRGQVREAMEVVYEQFLDRVKAGRGERLGDVSEVAAGRLFTGSTAVDNGMADLIGSAEKATGDLADAQGLGEGEYDVVNLPAPMSLSEYLDGVFGVRSPGVKVEAPAAAVALKRVLGDAAWSQVTRTLTGLMLLRTEPILTLMPAAIVVR